MKSPETIIYGKIAHMKVVVLLICLLPGTVLAAQPWVLVDSSTRTLQVIEGEKIKLNFQHVSTGRGGVSDFRFEGDGSTPRGTFKVMWINPNSSFDLFFGLNFPNREYAEIALRKRLININTYFDILMAEQNNRIPPQNTVMGGQIGIHGLGQKTNMKVHRDLNWTQGCVAVTNSQIHELKRWIRVGTKVIIR